MRAQAGPLSYRPATHHCVSGRLSRPHDGRVVADRLEAATEEAVFAAGTGRDSCSLSLRLPRLHRRRAGRRSLRLGCARFIEEKLFKSVLAPEEVAAIFVEPIQGEGGYVVAPNNFMRELRGICDRHGILLVADEVQSGMGRTGKWWAIQHTGVEPDIVCMAKGIASGMPLSACVSRAGIMDWAPGSHASTFGGNPVSIAAALATMKILEREGIANAARVGEFILERVRGWKQTHRLVGDVRGRGLMIGVELVKDKTTREPAARLAQPRREPGLRARTDDPRLRRKLASHLPAAHCRANRKPASRSIFLEDALTLVEKEL